MDQPNNENAGFLKAISILFIALFTGVVMFLVISVVLVYFQGSPINDEQVQFIFLIAISVFALVCLVSALSIYKKRIHAIATSGSDVQQKLNDYRAAVIVYLALCEGAALFSIIGLFLTGNYWLVVITVVMLAAMLFKKPSRKKIVNELQLNWNEEQQL